MIRHTHAYLNPGLHFSPAFYCGGTSGHVYSERVVYTRAPGRIPRRTAKYACGILPSRALYPYPPVPPRYKTWREMQAGAEDKGGFSMKYAGPILMPIPKRVPLVVGCSTKARECRTMKKSWLKAASPH